MSLRLLLAFIIGCGVASFLLTLSSLASQTDEARRAETLTAASEAAPVVEDTAPAAATSASGRDRNDLRVEWQSLAGIALAATGIAIAVAAAALKDDPIARRLALLGR